MSMNSKYTLMQRPYVNQIYYAQKRIYGLAKRGRQESKAMAKAIKEIKEAKAMIIQLSKYGGGVYGHN